MKLVAALLLATCASAWSQDTQTTGQDDPVANFNAEMARIHADVAAQNKAASELAKKPNARIGMYARQVREATNWGEPISVNRTKSAGHVQEQWVYGEGEYLYFVDGRLKTIQTRR